MNQEGSYDPNEVEMILVVKNYETGEVLHEVKVVDFADISATTNEFAKE